MKKVIIIGIFIIVLLTLACDKNKDIKEQDKSKEASYVISEEEHIYSRKMKQDILCIMLAYPSFIKDLEVNKDKVFLVLKSGRKILYDDKIKKTYEAKLNNSDIQDMLEQIYPKEHIKQISEKNFDPGRFRVYGLLKEVYGESKGQIQKNLINTKGGQFNKENNCAKSLINTMNELIPLAKNHRSIGSCLYPMSGTFCYRTIAGTSRLSPHSFGIAIDLARDNRDYWKWASEKQGNSRLKTYSQELVKIFEKNGFIWGGKWNHFDILHFEYRPEIILKSKYFSQDDNNGSWYKAIDYTQDNIKEYIGIIEKKLK